MEGQRMSVLDEVEQIKAERDTNTLDQSHKKESSDTATPELATRIGEESTILSEVTVKDNDLPAIPDTVVKSGLQKAVEKTVVESKDIKNLTRDLTYLKGASDLQSDDSFKGVYKQELAKQLVSDLKDEGKRQAIINQAKKQESSNARSTAFYDAFKPMFDLLGIKSAYGLIPMFMTILVIIVPFLIVSFIKFLINSVNEVFTAIAKFAKPAFWICTIVVVLILTAAIVLAALWGIDAVFDTGILA